MADDTLQRLIQGGIKAAQRGDKDLARKAFTQVLKQDPNNEAAWLGIATVANEKKDRLRALKRLLEINPANEQGLEAVRRLGLTPEQVLGTANGETEASVTPFTADLSSSEMRGVTPYDLDELGAPPLPGAETSAATTDSGAPLEPAWLMDDLIGEDEDPTPLTTTPPDEQSPAEPTSLDDELVVDDFDALINDSSVDDDLLDELRVSDDDLFDNDETSLRQSIPDHSDEMPGEAEDVAEFDDERYPSSAEIFANVTNPLPGQNGTPIPEEALLRSVRDVGVRRVEQHLSQVNTYTNNVEWVEKQRGLAGQREYSFLVARVALVALVFVGLLSAGIINALLSNDAVRAVVFAPTFTPSFTPTFTPTATPGVTNTPSPTPAVSLTPSPTFEPSVTPGNPNPNFPPDPTEIYLPQGLSQLNEVREAVPLIADNQLDEAFELLERARIGSDSSGNFIPYYWLTVLQLEQDDPEQARELVEQGEEIWQQNGPNTNYGPLVEVSYARVDLYEAEQALAAGDTQTGQTLLAEAEGHLREVLDNEVGLERLDQDFVEAWVLLSQRYLLDDDVDQALQTLDDAIANPATDNALFTDTRLRLQRTQIFLAQEELNRAAQELHEILIIDPFLEEALQLQIELALAQENPGLAVLFSEQYLFYHPENIQAFQLLGEARRAENKIDEALDAYARGLQSGDPTDPAYLDILISRAQIYATQERYALAASDLTEAIELSDDAPDIRLQRMIAAYFSGDLDTAEDDANLLLELEDFEQREEVLLIQARVFVDTATEPNDYRDALGFLEDAQRASGANSDQAPIIAQYRAQANFALGNLDDALEQIDTALAAEETGTRYYLRGQILEARGLEDDDIDDLQAAQTAYDFVLTWDSIFGFAFAADARDRAAAVGERIAELTDAA